MDHDIVKQSIAMDIHLVSYIIILDTGVLEYLEVTELIWILTWENFSGSTI